MCPTVCTSVPGLRRCQCLLLRLPGCVSGRATWSSASSSSFPAQPVPSPLPPPRGGFRDGAHAERERAVFFGGRGLYFKFGVCMFIANMQKYSGFLNVYLTSCDLQNSLLNPMGFLGIFYKDSYVPCRCCYFFWVFVLFCITQRLDLQHCAGSSSDRARPCIGPSLGGKHLVCSHLV